MAELLLELLSEEIPARMQLPMAENLRKAMEDKLNKAKLFYTEVKSFVTPRRLVLSVSGLSLTQEDIFTERKGPRIDAPTKAIEGFLRSTGLTIDKLTKKTLDKGEFYFAISEQKGKPTKEILKEAIEEIMSSMTWQKSMRWGNYDIRWVRPLKNICCIFGGEVLPITFGHIEANDKSEGHRFLSEGTFKVLNFKNYNAELKKRFVILETEERCNIITQQASKIAKDKKLQLVGDENLLLEVAGLVEWPEVLLGTIDEEYMQIPEEALISSIRIHQKYFCTRSKGGKLAPYFLVVSNMKTDDEGKGIIAGNERVLRARLADAQFFWDQDKKTPLDQRSDALEKVIFHAKLGSIADKTKHINAIATFAAVWIPHANLGDVSRAAILCKSDLVTDMVGEFPDLQGVMGAYYATDAGEKDSVFHAIKEHYSPLGPNDNCPTSPVSIAIALADKVDTIAGLFAINERPTGSKDPFALRRAALGVIRLILENRLSIPLKILFEHALKQYPKSLFKISDNDNLKDSEKNKIRNKMRRGRKIKPTEIVDDIMIFFSDRLKHILKAENIRHDLISAVFDGQKEDDLLRVVKRVEALEAFLATENGVNLLSAYRRATNIVNIEEKKDDIAYKGNPNSKLLELTEEEMLYIMMNNLKPEIRKALKEDRFADAMDSLSSLRKPIDEFFDKVKVNTDEADIRKNRLKLLAQMRELLDEIADFSIIEG